MFVTTATVLVIAPDQSYDQESSEIESIDQPSGAW